MFKQALVSVMLLSAGMISSAVATDSESAVRPSTTNAPSTKPHETLHSDRAAASLETTPIPQDLVREIADWLSQNFALLPSADLPRIEFASAERIVSIAYHGFVPAQAQNEISKQPAQIGSQIVAVYVTVTGTIYLPTTWRQTSSTDVSVLVHEMVHHLQNRAGLKYSCYQAREKLAYEAQEQWLARHGRTLQADFDVDKLTLLVRTSCGM